MAQFMQHHTNHYCERLTPRCWVPLLAAVVCCAVSLLPATSTASSGLIADSPSLSLNRVWADTLQGEPDSSRVADTAATGSTAGDTTQAAPADSATVEDSGVDTTGTSPADTAAADTTKAAAVDSLRGVPGDSLREAEPEKSVDTLAIWKRGRSPATDTIATDSLMRWEHWMDLSEKLGRQPGVFSYSMGTSGRWNALQIGNYQPDEMELYWNHVPLRDPLTGNVPWFSLPHHHIDHATGSRIGPEYETSVTSNLFYRLKPQTRFGYDEGKEGMRNMDFLLTQNVKRRHNIVIDYWDRQAGNEFPRSSVDGRQLYASTSHHLGDKYLLRSGFLQNALTIFEPFGYEISDPQAYNFYAPAAAANQRGASSDWNRKWVYLQLFQRQDSLSRERAGVTLYGMDQQRSLKATLDTTRYQVKSIGTNAFLRHRMGPLYMEGKLKASLFGNQSENYMSGLQGWQEAQTGMDLEFRPFGQFKIAASGEYRYRSDYKGTEPAGHLGGTLEYGTTAPVNLGVGAGIANRRPKLQALYHNEAGNSNLDTEKQTYLEAFARWRLNGWWQLRARGRATARNDAIGLPGDSAYVNLGTFQDYSAWVSSEMDLPHWEVSLSAQTQFSETSRQDTHLDALAAGDPKVWARGKVFYKNYVLDRAAYVKMGLVGTGSPNYYLMPAYRPHLNDWSLTAESAYNPPFYRVDAEVHAKIRSFMVHLSYENVMDQVGQLGYFESWPYPMPGRRLMFGLRVIFNN